MLFTIITVIENLETLKSIGSDEIENRDKVGFPHLNFGMPPLRSNPLQ